MSAPIRVDALTIEDTIELLGGHRPKVITRTAPKPVARFVYLSAPDDADSEAFWHRKAQERSRRISEVERVNRNLRDALTEADAENARLYRELKGEVVDDDR